MRSGGWRGAVVLAGVLAGVAPAAAQEIKYPVGMFGKYTPDGVLIQKVIPGTPADKGGLQSGDLILKVDGRLITSQDDFAAVINSSGGQVIVAVKKGSNGRVCRVGLDLAGTGRWAPPPPYFLGVVGTFTRNGVLIGTAIPGTPAARAGLDKGDLIASINNFPVVTQADFFTVLYTSGGSVTLKVKKASGRVVTLDVSLTTYDLGALGTFNRDGSVTIGVVAPATPAAYVGLQKGDVILRIDNQQVRNQKDFDRIVNNSGGAVTMLVRRPGQRATTVEVELMNNPLCAWCEPSTEGMRITAVVPGGPADAIGLVRGDTLVKIDDQRLRSNADLLRALRNARGLVTITYRSAVTERLTRIEVDLAR
ncbi:MAG TPA: PDZ domain-containing protein [Gemmataceae bacterium]|nr:PDZ domain-containing protein [Gemmataceae bacterium]